MLEQLSLANLSQVKGGLIEAMLAKALNRIATDIETAPDIEDWRKVTLEIRAKPVLDRGMLDDVAVEFVVKPTTPARVTSTRMQVRSGEDGVRQLYFQLDAPDNPRQASVLDYGEAVARARDENERIARGESIDDDDPPQPEL